MLLGTDCLKWLRDIAVTWLRQRDAQREGERGQEGKRAFSHAITVRVAP